MVGYEQRCMSNVVFISEKTFNSTSVASERVFSKGGCILTELRSSLSNEHASQHIYLSMNKDYVPKPIF